MSVAIYCRISQDRTGEGLGIERQLKDCRALAKRLGLKVDHVYTDNDTSATSGKVRPQFEAMLEARPAVIVAWHQDRLLRLSSDLEKVIKLNVPVYTVTAGTLDLSTPAGRAVGRTVAAWSTYEGEQKAVRQRAANVQRAEAGSWQFSRRPYGYQRVDKKVVIVEHEAEVIREAYRRYLAGEGFNAIATDLNERGIPAYAGGTWSITQLRERMRNPAYAGLVCYRGALVGQGDWEPLVTPEQWERFDATMTRRKGRPEGSNRVKYLLSGLATCGVCGAPMFARPDRKRMVLSCTTGWCVSRGMDAVDELVEAEVIRRLSQRDALKLLTPKVDVAPLVTESQELRARRDDLAVLLAEGVLSVAAVREQSAKLQARLDELTRRIASAEGSSPITSLVMAQSVAAHWRSVLTLQQKRAIIHAGLTVTIRKQVNTRRFDPEDVVIEWRKPAHQIATVRN